MLDGVYLILVFASNDEAVNSLAAEIPEFERVYWLLIPKRFKIQPFQSFELREYSAK